MKKLKGVQISKRESPLALIWCILCVCILAMCMTENEVSPVYACSFVVLTFIFSSIIIVIPERAERYCCGGLIVCSVLIAYSLMQHNLGMDFSYVPTHLRVFGFLLCFLIISTFILILGRPVAGIVVGMALLILISTIDSYVVEFRGSEITPMDLYSFATAMNVIGGYNLTPNYYTTVIWSVAALFWTILFSFRIKRMKRMKAGIYFIAVLVVCMVIASSFIKDEKSYRWADGGTMYKSLIVNLALEIRENIVPKPEGYNSMVLSEEVGKYVDASKQIKKPADAPNIIVVMNESFADLKEYGKNLKTDVEITPFLDTLEDNVVKGYAYTSVFGGNTANSEYEFLTANSMAFLPFGSVPYTQLIREDTYSVVKEIRNAGYRCVAMHPFYPNGWNRINVYPQIGFDETMFRESFSQNNLCRGFVTDKTMYKKIIKTLDQNNGNAPLFLFGVTVQNHGGYIDEEFKNTVHIKGLTQKYPDAEQYLSLIKKSDEAIEYLIESLEKNEEKVILLFFGDHFPRLDSSFFEEINDSDNTDDNLDEHMKKMKVPFFVWANYDIGENKGVTTSVNYLSNYIYELAGIDSPYHDIIMTISDNIPIICSDGFFSTQQGRFANLNDATGTEKEFIDLYRMLQYNNVYDRKNRIELFN